LLSEANSIARSFNLTNNLIGTPLEQILDANGVIPPNYPATGNDFTILTGKAPLEAAAFSTKHHFDDKSRIRQLPRSTACLGRTASP
jgi:hypothetical protein